MITTRTIILSTQQPNAFRHIHVYIIISLLPNLSIIIIIILLHPCLFCLIITPSILLFIIISLQPCLFSLTLAYSFPSSLSTHVYFSSSFLLTLAYSSSSPSFTYTLTFNNRAIEEIEKNYGDFIYSPEIFNNDM